MKRRIFFEKVSFFEKMIFFFKKVIFFIFLCCQPLGLWVHMRPTRHCGRVGTHHGGVQSDFMCLQGHLKKTGKFCPFKILFFCQKCAKMRKKKYFCVSGHLGDLKTYLDAKFQLIWPSNKASDHFWSLLGGQVDIPDHF